LGLTTRDLVWIAERLQFTRIRHNGHGAIYRKIEDKAVYQTTLPTDSLSRQLGKNELAYILRQMGLTEEAALRLLGRKK